MRITPSTLCIPMHPCAPCSEFVGQGSRTTKAVKAAKTAKEEGADAERPDLLGGAKAAAQLQPMNQERQHTVLQVIIRLNK